MNLQTLCSVEDSWSSPILPTETMRVLHYPVIVECTRLSTQSAEKPPIQVAEKDMEESTTIIGAF